MCHLANRGPYLANRGPYEVIADTLVHSPAGRHDALQTQKAESENRKKSYYALFGKAMRSRTNVIGPTLLDYCTVLVPGRVNIFINKRVPFSYRYYKPVSTVL